MAMVVRSLEQNDHLRTSALLVAIAIAAAACGRHPRPEAEWRDPVTGVGLAIAAIDKHPALRDHGRVLLVTAPNGSSRTLDLCADAGSGVHSNLYRLDGDKLVLIDANGVWVEIAPSGLIASVKWRWGHEPPPTYLGAFCAAEELVYRLVDRPEANAYLIKDPPTGIESDD